jgi:hypothetical protein
MMLMHWYHLDGTSRIPGRWAPPPHRVGPHSKNLPYAHLRAQRSRRQVAVLVLPEVLQSYRLISITHLTPLQATKEGQES